MLAKSIQFRMTTRTGPAAADRREKLDLTDAHFRMVAGEDESVGVIDVQMASRYVRVWNPRRDSVTKEPVEVIVPMENVASFEPLSDAQREKTYPNGLPAESEPKRGPGRPRKDEAA